MIKIEKSGFYTLVSHTLEKWCGTWNNESLLQASKHSTKLFLLSHIIYYNYSIGAGRNMVNYGRSKHV